MLKTAKSYENCERIGEPIIKGGKAYARIKDNCSRCGGTGIYEPYGVCYKCGGSKYSIKEVRLYTEKEYASMEKRAEIAKAKRDEEAKTRQAQYEQEQKEKLGFSKGYITLVLGETFSIKDTLKSQGAKYKPQYGWYFPSEIELPQGNIYAQLRWEDKDNYEFIKDLKSTFEPSGSFVGTIGERLKDITVICKFVTSFTGFGGKLTHLHSFEDSEGNTYIWKTQAKQLQANTPYYLSGTVKEHSEYKGIKQTILTRCIVRA